MQASPIITHLRRFGLFYLLILGVSVIRSLSTSQEGDVYWMTRAGEYTLTHHTLNNTNTWTWVDYGSHWTQNSWGWNVILTLAYKLFGLPGIHFFIGITTSIILLLILYLTRHATFIKQLGWILFSILGLTAWLSGRAQIADYLGLTIVVLLTIKITKTTNTKHLLVYGSTLFLLFIIWQNLHLTAIVGVGSVLLILVWDALSNKKHITFYLLLGIACLCSLFITPYGINGVTKSLFVANESKNYITEWMGIPQNIHADSISWLWWFLLVALTCACVVANRQINALSLLSVLFVAAGFFTIRFLPYAVFLIILLGTQYQPKHLISSPLLIRVGKNRVIPYGVFALSLIMTIIGVKTIPQIEADYTFTQQVPSSCKIVSDPGLGGQIILLRNPKLAWVDGRNDMFGKEPYLLWNTLLWNPDKALPYLDKNNVNCLMFYKDNITPQTIHFLKEQGWKVSQKQNSSYLLYMK